MSKKLPTWTRTRVGRNRVHWVAYDDQPGAGETRIVDQGYATSLVEADTAARAALADSGIYQARRLSKGFGAPAKRDREQPAAPSRPARPERVQPREYLYSRHEDGPDHRRWVAAHVVVKRTPRRVYVSRSSCGPDQVGTDDESWGPNEPTISLDGVRLKQDGSVFAKGYRQSEFYTTREAAMGDADDDRQATFAALGISAPCTVDEIKAAYRLKALAAHPDRGGSPVEFRAIEAAYRRLLREAQAPEA